jgi:polyhydroxyalkanoate synthesis repressor PhaR
VAEEARRYAERFGNARVIKRYGNRRLYDPWLSRGVTLEEIAGFIRGGEQVRIVDGDNDQDITRRVLIQILLEHKSARLLEVLPVELLRSLVALPSDPLARWLTDYLAAGARWLEWQMGSPAAQSGFHPWPPQGVAPEPPPPAYAAGPRLEADPPRPRKKKARPHQNERPPEPSPAGGRRAELDELWRRLGELRRP